MCWRRRVRRALIENHHHVRAQILLHTHARFRRQLDPIAVDRRSEDDALFADFSEIPQAEHLESTAVGQDRPLPLHEAMQATQVPYRTIARAEHQMEGVAEQDLGTNSFQIFRRHGLDRAVGPTGHEHRGLHHAMPRRQLTAPGSTIRCQDLKAHDEQPRRFRNMASP